MSTNGDEGTVKCTGGSGTNPKRSDLVGFGRFYRPQAETYCEGLVLLLIFGLATNRTFVQKRKPINGKLAIVPAARVRGTCGRKRADIIVRLSWVLPIVQSGRRRCPRQSVCMNMRSMGGGRRRRTVDCGWTDDELLLRGAVHSAWLRC